MTTLEFRFGEITSDELRLTTCAFSVFLDGNAIWPARGLDDALEIQIDDFLSHLAEYWKPLILRQTYPLALNPSRPSQLRAKAEEAWAAVPEQQAESEDEVLEAFQDCHDLSRCFAGYFDLPPLWLFRSGEEILIDTGEHLDRVSFPIAKAALQAAGDWIAERLSGDRWADLVASWRNRDEGDAIKLLQWSTSLDASTVQQLADDGLLKRPSTVSEAANDNDELRLAARMASALAPEEVRTILERVRVFPSAHAPQLDELMEAVRTLLKAQLANARPFEQGEQIADSVRDWLDIGGNTQVDVFQIVSDLGVTIYPENFDPPTLDALAVWGEKHGPAALLNTASERHAGPGPERVEERGQIRVTLAHELCHFLVDREHALAAVDVLRSRMPVAVEQRARAFAAQFLLPSRAAAAAWIDAGRPTDRIGLYQLLNDLCHDFTVSKSVASWKLQHGARIYNVELGSALDSVVPHR